MHGHRFLIFLLSLCLSLFILPFNDHFPLTLFLFRTFVLSQRLSFYPLQTFRFAISSLLVKLPNGCLHRSLPTTHSGSQVTTLEMLT